MTESPDPQAGRLLLTAILVLAAVLFSFPAWWGLPAFDAWAFDELRPGQVMAAADARFSGGWATNYPPLHYYLLTVVYFPVRAAESLGALHLEATERTTILYLLGRSLSVLMALGTVVLVYRTARLWSDRLTSCTAALLTTLILPFAYYSKTVNLEAPYLFWFTASLWFFGRCLEHHRLADYLGLAATATCAVGTKDQAFALYLLIPSVLVAALRGHRRSQGLESSWRAAVLDRRLWLSLALAVALFVLIFNLPFNFAGFKRHLAIIVHRSPSRFDVYAPSLAGYLAFSWQIIRHLVFALGLPILAAGVIGVARALRGPSTYPIPASILVTGLSYVLFFLVVIRHNYVRFLFPILILATFFAATELVRWLHWRKAPGVVRWAVVIAVLAWSLLRSLSIDFAMHDDPRYRVEEWLAARPDAEVMVIGRQNMVPRGHDIVPWRRVARLGVGILDRFEPDYVVLSSADLISPAAEELYRALLSGDAGYELEMRVRSAPFIDLVRFDGIDTNLEKLNPEQVVFARSRPSDAE